MPKRQSRAASHKKKARAEGRIGEPHVLAITRGRAHSPASVIGGVRGEGESMLEFWKSEGQKREIQDAIAEGRNAKVN